MRHTKSNKGFTLIEILAAITILGIISAIAVPAVYKYVTKTRDFSYDNMYKTVYDAVKNYRLDTNDETFNGISGPTYTKDDIKNLVELNYLDPLIDPADKGKQCTAEVYIFDCVDNCGGTNDGALKDHSYSVKLNCSRHSGNKTFNDNGDLLSNSEYNACLCFSDFTVKGADLKYNNAEGKDYDGSWTNKNIWIGNFKYYGINANDIDHFEYTTDVDNPVPADKDIFSFGDNADSYTFTEEINKEFRIRIVKKAEGTSDKKASAWSSNVYKIKIDKTAPTVTMAIINSNNNFEQAFRGTGTNNSYTHATWIGKSGNATPNVKISAKDNKSGVDKNLTVNYNTSGTFGTFKENWNKDVSGYKNFSSNNIFKANGLDDGYRVVNCTVKDKAGNEATGTIKVMIDTTPPAINLQFVLSSDKTNIKNGSYSCSDNLCEYAYSGWINKEIQDKISVSDTGSKIDNETIKAEYNDLNATSYGNGFSSSAIRKNNSFSNNIADGYRRMRYSVKDQASNITQLILTVNVDKTPPNIKATFQTKNSKGNYEKLFSANSSDSKGTFNGSGYEYNYEYGNWINSSKPIKKEIIVVTDKISGISDENSTRKLYNSLSSYSTSNQTNSKSDTLKFSETNKFKKTEEIKHDAGWVNGYRIVKYLVYDKAGNYSSYKVKFKVDTTAPTGSVTLLKGEKKKKVNTFKISGDFGQIQESFDLEINGSDNFSGISSKFKLGLNDWGLEECNYDDDSLKSLLYSFDASGSSTINSKDFKNGYRCLKFTLSDKAGNTNTIKTKIKVRLDRADRNECKYVDIKVRPTKNLDGDPISWSNCTGKDGTHETAYHVICKHDGKFFDLRYYYSILNKNKDNAPSKYICPNATDSPTPGDDLAFGGYKFLTKEESKKVIWCPNYKF